MAADARSKRVHCKVNLFDIITVGLDAAPDVSGLAWTEYPVSFAVNAERFTAYYQAVGSSSATWASIKNRLTRSKSGFVCLESTFAPPGYNKVYTHCLWASEGGYEASLAAAHSTRLALATKTADAAPPGPARQEPETAGSPRGAAAAPEGRALLEQFFEPDWLPVQLLERQPADTWQTFRFDVAHFLGELRALPGLRMNDFDKSNFELLLLAEEPAATTAAHLTTDSLKAFGERYGPWPRIVATVREFVQDGAQEWFYGKCDDSAAAVRALEQHGADAGRQHYLIRAVTTARPDPNLTYVFAITYRAADGAIVHERIYRDETGRLCMLNDAREVEHFFGFKHLARSLMRDPVPAAGGRFSDLVPQPAKRATVDAAAEGPGFKRHKKAERASEE